MKAEYMGELLPDGRLSLDQSVLLKIRTGEKLKIRVETLPAEDKFKAMGKKEFDPATKRILARLRSAPRLGSIKEDLGREEIYE